MNNNDKQSNKVIASLKGLPSQNNTNKIIQVINPTDKLNFISYYSNQDMPLVIENQLSPYQAIGIQEAELYYNTIKKYNENFTVLSDEAFEKLLIDYCLFLEKNTEIIIATKWTKTTQHGLATCLNTICKKGENLCWSSSKPTVSISLAKLFLNTILLLQFNRWKIESTDKMYSKHMITWKTFYEEKIKNLCGQTNPYYPRIVTYFKLIEHNCDLLTSEITRKTAYREAISFIQELLSHQAGDILTYNFGNVLNGFGKAFVDIRKNIKNNNWQIDSSVALACAKLINRHNLSDESQEKEFIELINDLKKIKKGTELVTVLTSLMDVFGVFSLSNQINHKIKEKLLHDISYYLNATDLNSINTHQLRQVTLLQLLEISGRYNFTSKSDTLFLTIKPDNKVIELQKDTVPCLSSDMLIKLGKQLLASYNKLTTDEYQQSSKTFNKVIQSFQIAIVIKVNVNLRALNAEKKEGAVNLSYEIIYLLFTLQQLILGTKITPKIDTFKLKTLAAPKFISENLLFCSQKLYEKKQNLHGLLFCITAFLVYSPDLKTEFSSLHYLGACESLLMKRSKYDNNISFFEKQMPWIQLLSIFIVQIQKAKLDQVSSKKLKQILDQFYLQLTKWNHPNGNTLLFLLNQQIFPNKSQNKSQWLITTIKPSQRQNAKTKDWDERLEKLGEKVENFKSKEVNAHYLFRKSGDIIKINNKRVIKQLFNPKEQFVSHEKYSLHKKVKNLSASKVNYLDDAFQLYFKESPGFPIQEIYLRILQRLMTGKHDHAELTVIVPKQGVPYYVLLTDRIEGDTLNEAKDPTTKKCYLDQPSGIKNLNKNNFAWLAIYSFLTNVGDLAANNIILEKDNGNGFHLNVIDTEQAWFETVELKGNKLKTLEKNILYFFPEMNEAYSPAFITTLTNLDIDYFLEQWLCACKNLQKEYTPFFKNNKNLFEDIKSRHYKLFIDKSNKRPVTFADVTFPKESINLLRQKLKQIQLLCKEFSENGKELTPNDMFRELKPSLFYLYNKARKSSETKTPFGYFKALDKVSSHVGVIEKKSGANDTGNTPFVIYHISQLTKEVASSVPFKRLKASKRNHNQANSLNKYYSKIGYVGPNKLLHLLNEKIKQENKFEKIITSFKEGSISAKDIKGLNDCVSYAPSIWLELIHQVSFEKIKSGEGQRKLIENLHTSFKFIKHTHIPISRFKLSHCKVLTDSDLSNILKYIGRELVYLEINDCTSLTNKALSYIGTLCPNLQILFARNLPTMNINQLDAIYNAAYWRFSLSKSNVLDTVPLKELYVEGCGDLQFRELIKWHQRLITFKCFNKDQKIASDLFSKYYIATDKYYNPENFFKFDSFKNASISEQRILLKWMESVSFKEQLSFADCSVLEDSTLIKILRHSSKLQSLNLSRCFKLTNKSIQQIFYWCPTLKKLILDENTQLTQFTDTYSSLNTAMELQHLSLNGCTQLKLIKLYINHLLFLDVQGCHEDLQGEDRAGKRPLNEFIKVAVNDYFRPMDIVEFVSNQLGLNCINSILLAGILKQKTTLYKFQFSAFEDHVSSFDDCKINFFTEFLTEFLRNNTTLRMLRLSSSQITDKVLQCLAESLKDNTTLTMLKLRLNLSYNENTSKGIRHLTKALKGNTTLTSIDLCNSTTFDTGAKCFAVLLKSNFALTTLDLSNNKIPDTGFKYLAAGLKYNTTLTTLNLSGNQITDTGFKYLAKGLKDNTTPTTLNLSKNQITGIKFKYFVQGLKYNTTLTTLNLSGNRVTGTEFQYLAAGLIYNTTLTTLDLSNNQIIDTKFEYLAACLIYNTTLTTLDLGKNQITDTGAQYLAEGLKYNTTLTTLNLSGNQITDTGSQYFADVLEKNTTLITLDIFSFSFNKKWQVAEEILERIKQYLACNERLQKSRKPTKELTLKPTKTIDLITEKKQNATVLSIQPPLKISSKIKKKNDIIIDLKPQYNHNEHEKQNKKNLSNKEKMLSILTEKNLKQNEWLDETHLTVINEKIEFSVSSKLKKSQREFISISGLNAHAKQDDEGSISKFINNLKQSPAEKLYHLYGTMLNVGTDSSKTEGSHWVLLLLSRPKHTTQYQALIINSLKENNSYDSMLKNIKELLELDSKIISSINIINTGHQTDSYNCGVWALSYWEQALKDFNKVSSNKDLFTTVIQSIKNMKPDIGKKRKLYSSYFNLKTKPTVNLVKDANFKVTDNDNLIFTKNEKKSPKEKDGDIKIVIDLPSLDESKKDNNLKFN